MGSPDFAVPCLKRLIEDGHNVSAVFTQPDKPKGRGHKLAAPPVKSEALINSIPVFQPKSLKNGSCDNLIQELKPDLIVVTAYGKILPKLILDMPKYGCVNIHASLLPKYRGAGPIQWAVINGEKKTGITSMRMGEGIDTGDMLLKMETDIGDNETYGELHDRLAEMGAECLSKTLAAMEKGELKPEKQDDSLAVYAPMIDKSMCEIDWSNDAEKIHNKIRGLSPRPGAYTTLDDKKLKIYKSSLISDGHFEGEPGEAIVVDKRLIVVCGKGNLELIEIQGENGKTMRATSYLCGHSLPKGTILGR